MEITKEAIIELAEANADFGEMAAHFGISEVRMAGIVGEFEGLDPGFEAKLSSSRNYTRLQAKRNIRKEVDDGSVDGSKYVLDRLSKDYSPKADHRHEIDFNPHRLTDEEKKKLDEILK